MVQELPSNQLILSHNGIKVFRRTVDFGLYGPDYTDLCDLTILEFGRLCREEIIENAYVNPETTIVASSKTCLSDFLRESELALVRWKVRLKQTIGRSTFRRLMVELPHRDRLSLATGFLFIDRKSAHIKRLNWRTHQ